MTFDSTILLLVVVITSCVAFDLFIHKDIYPKDDMGEHLSECATEFEQWGVTEARLREYSRNPTENWRDDNEMYDCAWACFFERRQWLDDDREGHFMLPIMLDDISRYYDNWLLRKANRLASRCIFVNYPHQPPAGRAPHCEQGKVLKDCLLKEVVLEATEQDKEQMHSMLSGWLEECNERPDKHCVWQCLFFDMGWLKHDKGEFLLAPVLETIKQYCLDPAEKPSLMTKAKTCVYAANEEDFNGNECGRSQYLATCMDTNFLGKKLSLRTVQAALEAASAGRTTITIAHRLATVRHHDLIAVVDKGVVAEMGSHDELVRMRGLYHDLLQQQGPY